jgi:hypothetical protein
MTASIDMSSAPARCAVAAANAGAMSSGFRTSRSWLSAPSARAASSTCFQRRAKLGHIVQGRNPDEARHHLLEQLEPFHLGVGVDRRQPSDVPAWTGEADRKPGADYIADRCHHDGNCSGRIPRSERGGCASGHDDIDIETYQFRRQCREAFGAAIGRSILNDEASTLVISELPETIAQGVEIGVGRRGYRLQQTDAPDPGRRLRARCERPRCRRAAERG